MKITPWSRLLVALLLIMIASPGAAHGQKPSPSEKPLFGQWQKVCKARIVLIGTLATRPESLPEKSKPLLLELRSVRVLKGPLPPQGEPVKVRYFLPATAPENTLRRVQGLFDKPVILFLGSAESEPDGDVVVGVRDETVLPVKPGDAEAVRAEVQNQAAIGEWFPTSILARPPKGDNWDKKWDKKVKLGLDRLVRDATPEKTGETPVPDAQKRQQAQVERMEQWGTEAVPALIRQLGDRRDLPRLLVGFTNPPGFWEGKYYSHPEKVVDAIDSLLFVLTRAEVTSEEIRSGGTEAQRASVTRAWQVYLFYAHYSKAVR